jgi:Uma2 family endonuclease
MSRLTSKPPGGEWSLDNVQHLHLWGVSWEGYEHLLGQARDRRLQITYDRGELEIMSPLPEHEIGKRTLGRLVEELAEELDVPLGALGSTTFKSKAKLRGLEPDECFYLRNREKVRGKKRINLQKDPPPDLVIEIDVTSRSIARLPIYASFAVPEIWRYDTKSIVCYRLDARGEYEAVTHSGVFPMLRPADLLKFVRQAEKSLDHTAVVKSFKQWMRKQGWTKST